MAFLGIDPAPVGPRAYQSDKAGSLHDPHHVRECRNIDLLSIDYAFRPRLRSRLTLGGFTFPRKPWVCGERDSHPLYRYLSRHMHFHTLHGPFQDRFTAEWNALLPLRQVGVRSFGSPLIPDHYRRQTPRPVSYYALFKWWLLLSQHPGCHGSLTSLRTKRRSGTLAGGLDCFPFDRGYCHSRTISRVLADGIRSLVEWGTRVGPTTHPVALPPPVATRG